MKYLIQIYGVTETNPGSNQFVPFSKLTTISEKPDPDVIKVMVAKIRKQNPLITVIAIDDRSKDPAVIEFANDLDPKIEHCSG